MSGEQSPSIPHRERIVGRGPVGRESPVGEHQECVIVVGNRGMTGKSRFLGSVPNSVSHQATCSVLIVATD